MKKLLIAAGSILTVLTVTNPTVNAADLPTKASAYNAPVAATFSWTGCYIGGNLGGAWSREKADTTSITSGQLPTLVNQNASSVIGGVNAGCNYQFDPHWVIGGEGDWSWTKLNANASVPTFNQNGLPTSGGGAAFSADTKWLASIRGRVGWVAMPNTLVYFTGGAAWAKVDYAAVDAFLRGCPNCAPTSFSHTKTGYVLGGGVDYAVTNNWIVRAEYLYYHFGGESSVGFFPDIVGGGPGANFHWSDLQIHEVRLGVNYKF
ncbi:MAG TPA: outer membrane protein [Pseudolabrys sp.]|nr:outer membrane protein [Pseudolabrys sp.]